MFDVFNLFLIYIYIFFIYTSCKNRTCRAQGNITLEPGHGREVSENDNTKFVPLMRFCCMYIYTYIHRYVCMYVFMVCEISSNSISII